MNQESASRPLFTLRTDEIAGRSDELQKLNMALTDLLNAADETRCFYIAGDGGMGKTRLLQSVVKDPSSPWIFTTNIIDFYNSVFRSDVDLVEEIVKHILPSVRQLPNEKLRTVFDDYVAISDRFRIHEVAAIPAVVRDEVLDAFVSAWQKLAEAGYRLIVVLDTAELLRFEDDQVRQHYDALRPIASARTWLNQMIQENKLPGTMFVIAGRERESRELYDELYTLANLNAPTNEERIIHLAGLSRPGINEYLDELAKTLQSKQCIDEAKYLRDDLASDSGSELREAFFRLTGGSPILLAILIQLHLEGKYDELNRLIDAQLAQKSLDQAEAQKSLQDALVQFLASYQMFDEDTSLAIQYMALARKGMTPQRLQVLLKRIRLDEYVLSTERLEKIIEELRLMIFCKERPDKSLVLHDKVAEWIEEGIYAANYEQSRPIFESLVKQYDGEIRQHERDIVKLAPKTDLFDMGTEADETAIDQRSRRDPHVRDTWLEYRRLRRERRNLLVDKMAYALQANPIFGYKHYYELAEQVFNTARPDYESQIRSEFLGWRDLKQPATSETFVNRQLAQAFGLTQAIIDADFAIRAVQREYHGRSPDVPLPERMRNTVALVKRIRAAVEQNKFVIPRFSDLLLQVYADTAQGQIVNSEAESQEIRERFEVTITELRSMLKAREAAVGDKLDDDLEIFLLRDAVAFAHYELAFFESAQDNPGAAIANFTKSLKPYRDLGFEVNQARSLNDKAFSLAHVGDAVNAETAILDAIDLRKQLGFSQLTALSYNTYGIVSSLIERPAIAMRYCNYALRIFRSLNFDFGEMLAERARSEAYRRYAEIIPEGRESQLINLKNALEASEHAVSLAKRLLGESNRQHADILNEHGCVYRDLARFSWLHTDMKDVSFVGADQQAEASFNRAIAMLKDMSAARTGLVDSEINLATLRYYRALVSQNNKISELDQAEVIGKQALQHIPERFRLPSDSKHSEVIKEYSAYWTLLVKGNSLLVSIQRERLNQLNPTPATQADLQQSENQLLEHIILVQYFSEKLPGRVRNIIKSQKTIYDSFKPMRGKQLDRLYRQVEQTCEKLGIPRDKRSITSSYLENNFGVG